VCRLVVCKVRKVICEWLASVLRVTEKPSQQFDDALQSSNPEDILDEGFTNHVEHQRAKTSTLSDPVLLEIREILQKKAERDEEERMRMKVERKIRREWMLAAQAVNRLCFIFFAVVVFLVTLIFFFFFPMHN